MKPRRLRNLAAQVALVPSWLIVIFAYVGTIVWTIRISFTNSAHLPALRLGGLEAVRPPVPHPSLDDLGREPRHLRRHLHRRLPGARLPARRLPRPEDPRRRPLPHDLPLSLRHVLHRHRPRLAVDTEPDAGAAEDLPRLGLDRASISTGWRAATGRSTWSASPASGSRRASSWRSCSRACAASTRISGRPPGSTAFRHGAST